MDERGRRVRGPIVLTVIGGVMLVIAVVVWLIAVNRVDEAAGELIDEGLEVRQQLVAEMPVPDDVEVDLSVGSYSVYVIEDGVLSASTTTTPSTELPPTTGGPPSGSLVEPALTVRVTGPDGGAVAVRPLSSSTIFPDLGGGAILYETATFDVSAAGTHTVAVELAPGSPPARLAGVGPEVDLGDAFESGLSGVLLIVVAVAVGVTGLIILLIALVWLAVAASSRSRPPPGPPPGQWGPPPGQWPPPPGQWGPPPGQW